MGEGWRITRAELGELEAAMRTNGGKVPLLAVLPRIGSVEELDAYVAEHKRLHGITADQMRAVQATRDEMQRPSRMGKAR